MGRGIKQLTSDRMVTTELLTPEQAVTAHKIKEELAKVTTADLRFSGDLSSLTLTLKKQHEFTTRRMTKFGPGKGMSEEDIAELDAIRKVMGAYGYNGLIYNVDSEERLRYLIRGGTVGTSRIFVVSYTFKKEDDGVRMECK